MQTSNHSACIHTHTKQTKIIQSLRTTSNQQDTATIPATNNISNCRGEGNAHARSPLPTTLHTNVFVSCLFFYLLFSDFELLGAFVHSSPYLWLKNTEPPGHSRCCKEEPLRVNKTTTTIHNNSKQHSQHSATTQQLT